MIQTDTTKHHFIILYNIFYLSIDILSYLLLLKEHYNKIPGIVPPI